MSFAPFGSEIENAKGIVMPASVWPLLDPPLMLRGAGAPGFTVIEIVFGVDVRLDVTPAGASVAIKIILNVPADDGVPPSWPAALSVRPVGSAVADHA
jgi:hypothetical protein